jgi:hypothetical protein
MNVFPYYRYNIFAQRCPEKSAGIVGAVPCACPDVNQLNTSDNPIRGKNRVASSEGTHEGCPYNYL